MPKIASITELGAYLTNVDDVYCFFWIQPFDSSVEAPDDDLIFELQIDTTDNFATVNLLTVTKQSAYTFYDGDVVKAFAVKLSKRQSDATYTHYWRIRVDSSSHTSDWSETQSLIVKQNYTKSLAQGMLDELADEFAYNKEASSTNAYVLFRTFARLLDLSKFEAELTADDNSINLARDVALQDNFGSLIEFFKSASQFWPEYRGMLKRIYDAFITYPGTEQGVKNIVSVFTGEEPTLINNPTELGWILDDYYLYDVNYPALRPNAILYDRDLKGFGFSVFAHNSWDANIDEDRLENLVSQIVPGIAKSDIEYPSHQHVSALFNTNTDWGTCTLDDTEVIPESVKIKYIGFYVHEGSITTPTIDCGTTIDTWDNFDAETETHGQTIVYRLSSSVTGAVWSDWENLTVGLPPGTTPVRRYARLQAVLQSGISYSSPILKKMRLSYTRTPGAARAILEDIIVLDEQITVTNITPPFAWCNDEGNTPNRGRWNLAQWA